MTGNPLCTSVYDITDEEYAIQKEALFAPKAYFEAWEEDHVTFLWVSGEAIEWYDFIYETEGIDFEKIGLWYRILRDPETEELSYESTEASNIKELELKKEEMYSIIEDNHPIRDMLYLAFLEDFDPEDSSISAIKTYLSWIMAELATNGKDADFTERL